MPDPHIIQTFTDRATLVSAKVHPATPLEQALEAAVAVCRDKAPLDPQTTLDPAQKMPEGARLMAAPNLGEQAYALLEAACKENGNITLVREGLRNYPYGIDVGVTLADFAIAETGTLVLDSRSEATRLATMLAEIHVALLPVSKIRSTAQAMAGELKQLAADDGSYLAFITGASRTSDIERVLTLGVHGPLELHIMLVEG